MARAPVLPAGIFGLLAIAIGALVAGHSPVVVRVSGPALAAACVFLVVLLVVADARRGLIAWDAVAFAMVGALVLGYGFANVGVIPGIPLPLADLIVAVVGAYSLTTSRQWPRLPPAFIAAGLYALIATCRLIIDFPTWGKDALRDYSPAVEMLSLPLGYWVVLRFGLPRLSRLLAWAFLLVITYSWLYPIRDTIGSLGPTVGLQTPVTLLGYFNGPALASAFFYFVIVRPFSVSAWIAAAALPPIALQQSRGLFIALPLSALLVLILAVAKAAGNSGLG